MAVKKRDDGYIPLDSSGNDYADMVGMSDLDKAALAAAGESWTRARDAGDKEGMAAARRQGEQIRAQYGYSGGPDGSQYLPFATAKQKNETYSYSPAPSYTSKYQEQIDDLTQQILDREAFSYDPNTDPLYQMYKEAYTRNGQRAMQDAMGQMAARTGGLTSSYAGAASQQQYDNYMGALADKIPELQQLAYSMYMDEGDTQRANQEMLRAMESGDWAKYQDILSQYNTDRSFDYGIFSDQRAYDYQLERDRVEDLRYNDETSYARDQDRLAQALERAQTLAAVGDYSGYKDLGYSDADIARLEEAAAAAAMASSGGRSGGGSGSYDEDENRSVYQNMADAGITSEGEAYEWLLRNGRNRTEAAKLAGYFAEWYAAQGFGNERRDITSLEKHGTAQGEAFYWNGRTYINNSEGLREFLNDLNAAELTSAERQAIIRRARELGMTIS